MFSTTSVPKSITREQYVSLLESVGIVARDMFSVEFKADGIYATVAATDAEGKRIPLRDGDAWTMAMHRIYVSVTDEEVAA